MAPVWQDLGRKQSSWSISQPALREESSELDDTRVKQSRRCVFSDLEQAVKACVNTHTVLAHSQCIITYACISDSTNLINIGAIVRVLGRSKICVSITVKELQMSNLAYSLCIKIQHFSVWVHVWSHKDACVNIPFIWPYYVLHISLRDNQYLNPWNVSKSYARVEMSSRQGPW